MRVFNFAAGPATLPLRSAASRPATSCPTGTARGMSVMEVSHRSKAFVAVAAGGGSGPARAARRAGQLQGAVPAGRRDAAVRRHPAEPRRAPSATRRLRQHRRLVEEGDRRGASATAQVNVAADEAASQLHARCRRQATLEADARARPTCTTRRTRPSAASSFRYVPETRRGAAGGGHVLDHPVAADRRAAVRPDLRRRAEEHRSGRARAS